MNNGGVMSISHTLYLEEQVVTKEKLLKALEFIDVELEIFEDSSCEAGVLVYGEDFGFTIYIINSKDGLSGGGGYEVEFINKEVGRWQLIDFDLYKSKLGIETNKRVIQIVFNLMKEIDCKAALQILDSYTGCYFENREVIINGDCYIWNEELEYNLLNLVAENYSKNKYTVVYKDK